jgi:glycosyltransferase involved in cell wall biosynthesis
MRVACVIHGREDYGVRSAFLSLIAGLLGAGQQVSVISLSGGQFADELAARGISVQRCGASAPAALEGGLVRKALLYRTLHAYSLRVRVTLTEAIGTSAPDIVHFVWPNHLPIVGPAGRAASIPVIWEHMNVVGSYPLQINRRLMQMHMRHYNVTALVPSRYMADSLWPGWSDSHRVRLLPLCVDTQEFDPQRPTSRSRTALGIPAEAVVIGTVARLCQSKGQLDLLGAVSDLPADIGEIHLLLLGEGDPAYIDRIRALATARGVASQVHLLGKVADPQAYYGVMDVAANARKDPEPFGLSVIEAMAMETPVLVHALGGPRDTVVDGVTGWHVTNTTMETLRNGLLRAVKDRPRWGDMGRLGRQRVVANYSVDVHARDYVRIADQILAQQR